MIHDPAVSLDPAVALAAAGVVLGHLDGESLPSLTVWQAAKPRSVTLRTAPGDDGRTVLEAARSALAEATDATAQDRTRVLDLDGDFVAGPRTEAVISWPSGAAHPTVTLGAGTGRRDSLTADRIVSMLTAVAGFLADPRSAATPLSRLPLLTPDERKWSVTDLNRTETALPTTSVARVLAGLAVDRPGLPAVVTTGRTLDRGELQSLAAALAADLRRSGVGPGDPVHLCLPRGADLVVAWVAVLGMGAVCVPVDPGYPPDRIRRIAADVPTLVSVPSTTHLVPHTTNVTVDLDDLAARPSPGDGEWPVERSPSSVAYVMHTSGSTGTPKGAVILEQGLRNLLSTTARQFGLGEGRRCLQLASPGFDVCVWEIFAALYAGAAVVPFEEAEISPGALAECVARHEADTVFALSSLLSHLDPNRFPGVRTVVTGGELFSQDLVDRWQPGRDLIYVYGPTEATVFQSWHRCAAGAAEPPPTVGRPMDNLRYYVLDPWGGHTVPGAIGELFIGGAGPGAGYAGLPEATAEKFVVMPSVDPGRLYRTGDLVSFRPDGNLDFRGRADNQVKVRGFRIELGEIETVLTSLPGIDSAVAVVHEAPTERLLVAYVVGSAATPAPDPARLRERLAEELPSYMVPTAVVALTDVPYTPNGKVDRGLLAARELPRAQVRAEPGTVGGPVLDATRAAFAAVLSAPAVGADDDFFVLGGHSLAAAELAAALAQRLGARIRAIDVFECPTPSALAGRALERGIAEHPEDEFPAGSDPDTGEFGLLPVQEWQWLLHQTRPEGDAAYNVPALFDCGGALDPLALDTALAGLQQRHALLRAVLTGKNGRPYVRLDGPQLLPETVDLSRAVDPEAALTAAVRERAHRPFDLENGPLLRVTLFMLPDGRHRLLTVAHHIVCDGPGLEILARDLCALHDEAARQEPGKLPGLVRDASRTAAAQAALLESGALDHQLEYWRALLVPHPEPLPLPIDLPRTGRAGRHCDVVRAELDEATTEALRALAREVRSGLLTPVAAAVAMTLNRATSSTDLCLGTPVNLRGELALTDQLTCCVNSVALRLPLRGGSCAGLLGLVAERVHEAIDHARYPFDRLVRQLAPPVAPSRNPLFDVWVTCYPRISAGSGPGLTLTGGPVPLDTGMFELSFQGCERPDGLSLLLQYDRDLYLPDTAQLLLDQVVLALTAIAETPSAPWTDLNLHPDQDSASPPRPDFGGFRFEAN
ncbi:amino acid adenylation domain-containing protein [Streptomyces sp. BRA346]|uniref:amino acid adenylation domain-containing protein n=1 Tax=Streptomyces sp. BRA346 TaxID=2878199 RepID=UPI004062A016